MFPNFKLTVAFKGAVCQCMPTLRSASLNHKEEIEVVVDLQIIVRLHPYVLQNRDTDIVCHRKQKPSSMIISVRIFLIGPFSLTLHARALYALSLVIMVHLYLDIRITKLLKVTQCPFTHDFKTE